MSSSVKDAIAKSKLLTCTGFNPTFLSTRKVIKIEGIIKPAQKKLLPSVEGNSEGHLNYENLTVLYNKERKLPFLSIYGIDASKKATQIKRTTFRTDPRVDSLLQLDKRFYDLRKDITEFEIGHMAANHEMAWGENAQTQSYQTFHFPNSVPQAEKLNSGMWRDLEAYIVKEAATILNNPRIVVITGPVLQKNDPAYKLDPSFKIPLLFFKVVLFSTTKGYYSTAFIMSHEQKMIEDGMFLGTKPLKRGTRSVLEKMAFENYTYRDVYQVNIKTLEKLSGLNFTWAGVKSIQVPDDANKIEKLKSKQETKTASNKRGFQSTQTIRQTTLILP